MTNNITLEDLNTEELHRLIAPITYLVILMVVGIPGNLVVLLVYRKTFKTSVYKTIIWNLALTDFLFCTLTFPFNIGRLIRYYTFTDLWVCKTFTTIIIFFVMYSSHVLITLAIHRFRQVCFPLKQQITTTNVKFWIIGGILLAAFLDIPECVLQPIDNIEIGYNITGHVCAVSFHTSVVEQIYNGFLTCLFTSYTLILFVLYILIGRRMYRQRQIREQQSQSPTSSDEISNKITKIAVTVSAVFALSYVPLFVLKLAASAIDESKLSSAEFAVLKIFERSYAFNHTANPFIYAFYDNKFRLQIKQMIWSMCCRRPCVTRGDNRAGSVSVKEET